MRQALVAVGVLWLSSAAFAAAPPDDQDHPLIQRFPGSAMKAKQVDDYADVSFTTGCDSRGQPQKIALQGKRTRIGYVGPLNKGHGELFANYAAALKRAGFEVLHETSAGGKAPYACGYSIRGLALGGLQILGSQKIIIARKKGTYVQVLTGDATRRAGPGVYIAILEQKGIATDQVTVNADYLAQELERSGHVAVYGILFDTDSDRLKAESKPTLEEISKLMRTKPSLRLYVVGHSDMQGDLKYNLDLSQRRAASTIKELVTSFGIAAGRLQGHGLGPLAPKATNRSEDGRKQNRRVELIEIAGP